MLHTQRPPSVIRTFAALEAEAQALGFQLGFPPSLSHQCRHADLASYRKAKCPACGSRMAAVPFHKPAGGYKLILRCRVCGAGEVA